MSGTPLQNSPEELFSYFAFLDYKPYNGRAAFIALMRESTVLKEGLHGLNRLRNILAPIMLRRTKQSQIDGEPIVQLPGTCVTCPDPLPWTLHVILHILASHDIVVLLDAQTH